MIKGDLFQKCRAGYIWRLISTTYHINKEEKSYTIVSKVKALDKSQHHDGPTADTVLNAEEWVLSASDLELHKDVCFYLFCATLPWRA